ncbi:MAG TPA: DUF5670 family protein [Pyrinomonadaceae bacterium]|jgi:hypothetical protein
MLWVVSAALLLVWVIGLIFHKGGFLHILLLCAIAIILVQLIAGRRAAG